jgi:hypothetical protein
VKDIELLREDLGERAMAGFGGVAEYGITVRWDKNYLKLVRLLLERRTQFSMFGGVRFGGTVTVEDAFAMGFDHVALCAGAGKPTVLDMPNGLARGVACGVRLPDGPAAHRRRPRRSRSPTCRFACLSSWSAAALTAIDTAPSRSPTTRSRSRNSWRATRSWSASAAKPPCGRLDRRGARDRRRVPRPWPGDSRGACQPRRRQGRDPAIATLVNGWGGCHDRLSSAG